MKALITLSCMLAVASSGFAGDSHASQLGKDIRMPTNIGFSNNVSDDGQVATILFDNLIVEVSGPQPGQRGVHNQTAIDSKLVTLNVPYSTDMRSVSMEIDVRGYVNADTDTNARLILSCGETTKVLPLNSTQDGKKKKKKEVTDEATDTDESGFSERVTCRVQTHAEKPICQLTLVLIIDRNSDQPDAGGGSLHVDSLNITLGKGGKSKLR